MIKTFWLEVFFVHWIAEDFYLQLKIALKAFINICIEKVTDIGTSNKKGDWSNNSQHNYVMGHRIAIWIDFS